MKKKAIVSIILNTLIFVLVSFATISMIFNFNIMSRSEEVRAFTAANLSAFKYYTVDSNVFGGLLALVYIFFEIALAKGKITRLPKLLHLLRLAAATGLTLTMLVTAFFLIPQFGENWAILYIDNNFFFHLTVPLLSIITFIFFEPDTDDISLKDSLFGIITMAIYAVFYTINIIAHLNSGNPLKDYDWYGFLGGNISNALIAVPAMLLITWLISLGLWIGNRKINLKK
ncbi:MAG: hypothetical protein IK024_04715 [Treponema sp.]|nr:hypothetical protein [Treponema sp.]